MTTNIPPHNLTEVVDACTAIIDNPGLEESKLLKIIKAPDSVRQAQLNAWQALIEKDSATNPEFKAIIASLRDWAQRVVPWQADINIPTPDLFAYNFYFKK